MMIKADEVIINVDKVSRFVEIISTQSNIKLGIGKVEKITDFLAKIIIPRLTEDIVCFVISQKYPIEIKFL